MSARSDAQAGGADVPMHNATAVKQAPPAKALLILVARWDRHSACIPRPTGCHKKQKYSRSATGEQLSKTAPASL